MGQKPLQKIIMRAEKRGMAILWTETSSIDCWTMFKSFFQKRDQILIKDFVQGDKVISTNEEKGHMLTTTFPSPPSSDESRAREDRACMEHPLAPRALGL